MIHKILLMSATLSIYTTFGWAGEQVGTLTQIEGTVKIFSHPSKTLPENSQAGIKN